MFAAIEGAAGGPDLVLLHGGIGTGRSHWSKQVEALRERHRVHLVDLPGHGQTPLPDGAAYTRALLTGAVEEYLAGLARPAWVGGFSLGGQMALALLQRRPSLFAGVVLVGISVHDHDALRAWRAKFAPDVLEATFPLWAGHLRRVHAPLGPEAWRDVCRRDSAGLDIDVDPARLGGFDRPVLLVRGDRDPAVLPQHYARLRACWPQAEELVVPAGGHDVQLTRSALVTLALTDFLGRHAS